MCQECQEVEVGYSESSEAWDQTVEYKSEETLLNSGIKEDVFGKICPKCGEWKPFSDFGPDKNRKDLHTHSCRLCGNEKQRKRVVARKEKFKDLELSGVKVCTCCGLEKPYSDFNRAFKNKDGYDAFCRDCHNKQVRSYTDTYAYLPNLSSSKICSDCGLQKLATEFFKFKNHKDGLESYCKVCSARRKRARYATDIEYRLRKILRARLRDFVKRGDLVSKGAAIEFLGCTVAEFKHYLEGFFYTDYKTGAEMTWENYGKSTGWTIDHIIPLSRVKLVDPVQCAEVCNFRNLAPLWWWENSKKSNKLPSEVRGIRKR